MHGALVILGADATGLSFPVNPVPYDQQLYDTGDFFNPANPGILTMPAGGFTFVKVKAGIEIPATTSAGTLGISIQSAGDFLPCGTAWTRQGSTGFSDNAAFCETPWLPFDFVAGTDIAARANVSGLGNPSTIWGSVYCFISVELRE